MNDRKRCDWVPENDALYRLYHDEEWGVPLHDDLKLFELLILEGAQAGLSWRTILYKRENFREAYDHFDPEKIANYDEFKVESLMNERGIIRNRLKINSVIQNAKSFIAVREEFGTFESYIWEFTGNKQILNEWNSLNEIPSRTPESDAISRDLLKRRFKFVGSTICYSFMQATGMVNDHMIKCFRHKEILELYKGKTKE